MYLTYCTADDLGPPPKPPFRRWRHPFRPGAEYRTPAGQVSVAEGWARERAGRVPLAGDRSLGIQLFDAPRVGAAGKRGST